MIHNDTLKELGVKGGDCYHQALSVLMEERCRKGWWATRRWRLVQAYITAPSGPTEGRTFGHAWVELPGRRGGPAVMDIAYGIVTNDRQEYLDYFKVQDAKRYTLRQAVRELNRRQHYGPWHGRDVGEADLIHRMRLEKLRKEIKR